MSHSPVSILQIVIILLLRVPTTEVSMVYLRLLRIYCCHLSRYEGMILTKPLRSWNRGERERIDVHKHHTLPIDLICTDGPQHQNPQSNPNPQELVERCSHVYRAPKPSGKLLTKTSPRPQSTTSRPFSTRPAEESIVPLRHHPPCLSCPA